MRWFTLIAAMVGTLFIGAMLPNEAEAGCYRAGFSGYHWYHSCFGPHFMYPHHRVCSHGYCRYH